MARKVPPDQELTAGTHPDTAIEVGMGGAALTGGRETKDENLSSETKLLNISIALEKWCASGQRTPKNVPRHQYCTTAKYPDGFLGLEAIISPVETPRDFFRPLSFPFLFQNLPGDSPGGTHFLIVKLISRWMYSI